MSSKPVSILDMNSKQSLRNRSKSSSKSNSNLKLKREDQVLPRKIQIAKSQKLLQFSGISQHFRNGSNLAKPVPKTNENLTQTEIVASNRIETPFEWQMGGAESFLNQKFTQIQTSSKKSLIKFNAANFVSQSYQTTSLPMSLIDGKNSNLDSIKEEKPTQHQSATKYPTIEEPFLTKQHVLKANEPATEQAFTRVYVMGETKYGQLGFMLLQEQESVIKMPKMCSYNILINQIACGEAHTHILSKDGFVYSMGSNHYGVLGLSVDEQNLNNVTEPQLITTLSSITQIATGRAHSLALAANRRIYAWGRQENGALSVRIACTSVPAVLDFHLTSKKGSQLAQIVKVACGLEHSMFLTNDGEVFVCGEGENGQLGLGYCSLTEYRPLKVRFKELLEIDYIVDIACGAYHSLFLSRHHQVFSTGLNNLGQLGIATDDQKIYVPQLISELQGRFITMVEAGESSFALNDQGDLFVWGLYNSQVFNKPFRPSSITMPIKKVSQSFYGITAAVDFENRFWVWDTKSQNSLQNLELQSYPQILRPMRNKHVSQAFTGRGMVFALGEDLNTDQIIPETKKQKPNLFKEAEVSDTADETCQSNIQIQFSDRAQQKPKIPDLNLTEIISEECTDQKPVRKRSKSRLSSHSRSQSKKRQRSKSNHSQNAKRHSSQPRSEKIDMPLVTKTPSRSKSRDVSRLGMSKSFYDKKTIALLKALKIINQAAAEVQNVNSTTNLVSKKFQQLQKRLEEDAIDIGRNKPQINRLKSKSKPTQHQQNEVISPTTKLKVNLKKQSKRKTSRSHSRGRSKGRASSGKSKGSRVKIKQDFKLKPIIKSNSLIALGEQSKSIEDKHKFQILSAAKEISFTMQSPVNQESIQVYESNKVIDDQSHESSIVMQEKKLSQKPLTDSQFQVQHQALESYQDYAKTTMQSLYHKIDEMRSENASLRRELDLQKRFEAIAKEELIKNTSKSNSSLIIADRQLGSVESKLRTFQIENETLKLQKSDSERKVAQLEDWITKLQMSKNKEDEYLAQLGKSCETLRKERTHIKDLQNQVISLTKALAIVEATLGQVKQDKHRIELHNKDLLDQQHEIFLEKGLAKNNLEAQKLQMKVDEAKNNRIRHFEQQQQQNYQLSSKMTEVQIRSNEQSQRNPQLTNTELSEIQHICRSRLESQRSNFTNKMSEVASKYTQEEQRSETSKQVSINQSIKNQSQHCSQRSRSVLSGSALAKNVKLRQSSKTSGNQSSHSHHSSKSGNYAQIIHQRISQSSLNEDEKQSRGRNPQLVDQVFKRSAEGSSENKKRSQQNSRSNKRKSSLNMTADTVKTPGGFIQEKLGIKPKPTQYQNADIYYETKPKRQSHFDTKETGRFVDPQLSSNKCQNSSAEADLSKNYTRNTQSQLDYSKQNLHKLKQYSPQRSSPLRLHQEDQSKHQPLRDKQANRAVPISNDYNSDLNVNALHRFSFIHKKSGDTVQDLQRNQRYGHFGSQQNEISAAKDYQITSKGFEIEPDEVSHYKKPTMMQLEDFLQEEHPVSDETRRQIKALKTNAIQTQDPSNSVYETQQPDSRRTQEDFKTFTPSMRYRDESPEGKKQIIKLKGLEKENIMPEDRLSRQEQYNLMLINNLEKLAEKKKEALQFSNRDSRSKDSHEKFAQILELPQASLSSPAKSNTRSSQPRFGSALNQYNVMNSQPYPFRKQNCVFELDQSYAIVPIQEQIRSRSRGSHEAGRLTQSNNSAMADAQRRKTTTPAISETNSTNSFLAKREALQNRLRNL